MLTKIEVLRDLGVADAAIRATLKKSGEYTDEDILAALPIKKKVGFASGFYAYLAAESRSTEEVSEYINRPEFNTGTKDEKGKTNVQRHESHYEEIAKMARAIHAAS